MTLFTVELDILRAKTVASHMFFLTIFAKIKVNSDDYLPIEKKTDFAWSYNKIKSFLNKDKNDYYFKIFLEKCSYQLAKNNHKCLVHSIIKVRFAEKEVVQEQIYTAKRPIKFVMLMLIIQINQN